MDFKNNGSITRSKSESGFATSFKLGVRISNQLALYYVRNASWYSQLGFNGFVNTDITVIVGISGFGLSYYLQPSTPSVYLLGALGIGDLSAPFESNFSADTGSAIMFGGGYEYSEHMHFEAVILNTNIDSADNSQLTVNTTSFQLTFNYLWY